MEINKALKVREALLTLADVLDCDAGKIAAQVCFFDDKKHAILLDAQKSWVKFYNCDIVGRGKMLGITITMCEEAEAQRE
jgi:hypothetical protein